MDNMLNIIVNLFGKLLGCIIVGNKNVEIEDRIKNCYEKTVKDYHSKYGNIYGDELSSFLVRQSNIDVLETLFNYSYNTPLSHEDFDLKSFDGYDNPPKEVVIDFINLFKKNAIKDFELSKILAEKEQRLGIKQSINNIEDIKNIIGESFKLKEKLDKIVNSIDSDFVQLKTTDISLIEPYCERNDIMDELNQVIKEKKKTVLLSGIGGIGKTQIVRKLYHDYLEAYKSNSSDLCIDKIGYIYYDDSLDMSLVMGFDLLNENQTFQESVKIAWSLLDKISSKYNLLLIIDNVIKSEKEDESLKKLKRLSASVVMTSRMRELENYYEIKVDTLSLEKCMELFEAIYNNSIDNHQDLEYILDNLVRRHTKTVVLLAKISKMHKWEVSTLKKELLECKFNIKYDSEDGRTNLYEEYDKLFNLSNLNDSEKNILEKFSLMPYVSLDLQLLTKFIGKDLGNDDNIDLDLNNLFKKGWLEEEDKSYVMHPLISEVIKKKDINLENHQNLIYNLLNLLNLFNIIYLDEDYASKYTSALQIMPIAINVTDYFFENDKDKIVDLLFFIGNVCYVQGEYTEALSYYKKTLDIQEKNFGKEDTKIVAIYSNIGLTYSNIGEYTEALSYYKKTLDIQEKNLGQEHLNMATIYNNIGGIYDIIGEYTEALSYYKKTLGIQKKILKPDHEDIVRTYINLGSIYNELCIYIEADSYYEQALAIQEKNLRIEHPYTAIIYNNIGGVYQNQCKLQKAVSYYRKALAISEKIFGKEHPDTLLFRKNINNILNNDESIK